MSLHDYVEKLKSKPERQRERIAVIATGVTFFLIFLIWLVSMSEADKAANEKQQSSAANQIDEFKNSIGRDKQSIEEMMQSLPQEETTETMTKNPVDQGQTNVPADKISAEEKPIDEKIPELP